jgi:hypothetical protein
MTNIIEQNYILYYADFLALKNSNTTVTDNCKYYFIYNSPINSAFLTNNEPFYDLDNPYYKYAEEECNMIQNKYGLEGLQSYVNNLCNISALGCVDAKDILKCIHKYSTSYDRKDAMK